MTLGQENFHPGFRGQGHHWKLQGDAATPGQGGGALGPGRLFPKLQIYWICLAGFWVRLGPITCFFFLSFGIRMSILRLPHHCTLKAQNLSVFTGSQLERTYHWGRIVLWVSSILIQIIGGARLVTKLCLTLATPWTIIAWKIPLSMGFSRQVYWSGLPFPSLGIFQTQELNPGLLHCRQILYRLSYKGSCSFRSYLFFYLEEDYF